MYLSYYGLKEKPFSISTNPKFLWFGEKHKEAFSVLKYGVLDNKGFLLLTGDVGAGKTTLIHALTSGLANDVTWAAVPDPGLELLDFCKYIASEFKLDKTFNSKAEFLIIFKEFLLESYNNSKKVLLIIDEAQRLSNELLEEIRMLSNIELGSVKLLNIFFVGQVEFNGILVDERNRAVRQRITVSYHIKPLSEKETGMYIRHRLKVAGAKRNIFSFVAVNQIYKYSKGCPRLINIICDLAMLTGYSKDIERIGVDIIDESIKNFEVETNHLGNESLPVEKRNQSGKGNTLITTVFLLLVIGGLFYLTDFHKSEFTKKILSIFMTVEDSAQKKSIPDSAEKKQTKSLQPKLKTPETNITQKESNTFKVKDTAVESIPVVKEEQVVDNSVIEVKTITNSKMSELPFEAEKTIIGFNHNSNEFPEGAYKKLDIVAEFMKNNEKMFVFITGYTDELGSYAYNVNLSIFRANIVKSYFIGKGIDKSRIKVAGLGSADPVASNATPDGRRLNRRVEIELFNFYQRPDKKSVVEQPVD